MESQVFLPRTHRLERLLSSVRSIFSSRSAYTREGRVGTYYSLAEDVGCALTVGIAPEASSPRPSTSEEKGSAEPLPRCHGATPGVACRGGFRVADGGGQRPKRLAGDDPARSDRAADPVDRATGRLVHLPDTRFLVGELDARQT